MDPNVEYSGEGNKYGVAKSVTDVEEKSTPQSENVETESRGLFGFGGRSDTSSSFESESEEGKDRQRRRRDERAARKRPTTMTTTEEHTTVGAGTTEGAPHKVKAANETGTDYSLDSIEGGNPTGGTNYSGASMETGHPTGGTDYSGASAEGGHPTGGTDYSGADLGLPKPTPGYGTTGYSAEEKSNNGQKKHHGFFG